MNRTHCLALALLVFFCLHAFGADGAADSYAVDDAHNHDGSHPDGGKNCGSNYMLPGSVARLGSHSFLILGQVDENHILAEHRSGTPPHNYQFILKVRLNKDEMGFYKKLLAESKLTPAFTTIYFDDADSKKQLDRTFFCLADLPKIFGDQKKVGDEFEKLFPIRASLQKDADFEGAFDIQKSIYPGGHFTLNRDDIELIVYRYIPSYLDQQALRTAIKAQPQRMISLFHDGPLSADEFVEAASKRKSYALTDGTIAEKDGTCPSDFYLKKGVLSKTIHSFLLLDEIGPNTVVASHYYDQAPQNFQTILNIHLTDKDMAVYRQAKEGTTTPPLFQTQIERNGRRGTKNYYFCMADLKKQIADGTFHVEGTVYKNSSLNDYKLGEAVGTISINASQVQVLTNRRLVSLLNPLLVAKDVLGDKNYAEASEEGFREKFSDVAQINPGVHVEMRYFSHWNFMGRRVDGYEANKCLLTAEAARALSQVQDYVHKMGYSLLTFDCYRPARAVTEFVQWAQNIKDQKMRDVFYPVEPKKTLVERGYIADHSSHSRGSTMDLTLVKDSATNSNGDTDFDGAKLKFQEDPVDCRHQTSIASTGQLDMGSTFDCFDPVANTMDPHVSPMAMHNRLILKEAMEKFGFTNYSKEWWHFTLNNEPFKETYFDFVVR